MASYISPLFIKTYFIWCGQYRDCLVPFLMVFVVVVVVLAFLNHCRTSRKLQGVREQLSLAHQKNAAMIDSILVGVELYDEQGELLDINTRAMEMYGMTEDKATILNRRITCATNPNLFHFDVKRLLEEKSFVGTFKYDFDLVNRTGYYLTSRSGTIDLETKISPLRMKNNELHGFLVLTNDVTQEKEYKDELEKSNWKVEEANLLLTSILNQSPCAIFIKDVEDDFRYIVANDIFCGRCGVKHDDLIGKTDYEAFAYGDAEKFRKDDVERVECGGALSFVEDVVWLGERVYWHTTKTVIVTPEGKKLLIGLGLDVTDSVLKQKALEESEVRTQLALRIAKLVQWEYDTETHLFYTVNERTASDILTPDDYRSVTHPDDLHKVEDKIRLMNERRNEVFEFDVRFKFPVDKEWQYITVVGSPLVVDEKGNAIKYTGMQRNFTEWYCLAEQLKEKMEMNKLILQNMRSGLVYLTSNYDVKWENVSDKFSLEFTNGHQLFRQGLNCHSTHLGITKRCEACMLDAICEKEGTLIIERTLDNGNVLEIVGNPIIDDEGKIDGMILCVDDITERKHLYDELYEAKNRAEESDKLKSAFLANMSHEIRTPLNAIVGFSDLMKTCTDGAEKEEYSNIISTNNELLLRLINDILDLSKLDSGIMQFNFTEFDLSHYIEEMMLIADRRMTNPNVELLVDNPYEHCIVVGDKDRITQVWMNFITNAIKYTPSGYIKIGYSYIDEGIKIYVEDSGIGISEEKKCKMFQRFEKLDTFAQGTGLGLSICKAITDLVGGKVGFESTEGKGSTFWAWRPVESITLVERTNEGTRTSSQDVV